MLRTTIKAAVGSFLLLGPAHADVLYQFVPTSYSGQGASALPLNFSFEVTDAAEQKGSLAMIQLQNSYWLGGGGGLDSITASAPGIHDFLGPNGGNIVMGATFGTGGQITSFGVNLFGAGGTEELLGGGLGNFAAIKFSSDNAGYCKYQYACTAFGYWKETQVPVPEPVSLALFGSALIGLGTVVRRRRS